MKFQREERSSQMASFLPFTATTTHLQHALPDVVRGLKDKGHTECTLRHPGSCLLLLFLTLGNHCLILKGWWFLRMSLG